MMSRRTRYRTCAVLCLIGMSGAPAQAADAPGIYVNEGCEVCHGTMGQGGGGPAFVHDPLLALPDYVVARILLGGGAMPPFNGRLSDDEIAAVATYVRTVWGGQSGEISPGQVATYRQQILHEPKAQASAAAAGSNP